jgi:hypothetical protein
MWPKGGKLGGLSPFFWAGIGKIKKKITPELSQKRIFVPLFENPHKE